MTSDAPKKPIVSTIINFLTTDIWRIKAKDLKGQKSFWIRQLRIFLLAIRGFAEDKCQLRASALTFFSLLSIVPVVAMAFGVAKGFGFEKLLEKQLLERFQGQEEVITQVIGFATNMLENTQGGVIAGVGVIFLFWTVIKVLGNIENSFNDIWGIKKARALGRKFADYLSIMLLCPFLLILSSSVTALIVSQGTVLLEKLSFLGPIATLIMILLGYLPYAVLWVLFTFIYKFMPNTGVKFKSALIAGVVAGTIYQVVQSVYMHFQVGVAKAGAIYGSFAALPLFLIWLQLSWLVVLFGAELSFAEQNVETYEFEPDCLKASRGFKRDLSLRIAQKCVKIFDHAEKPSTADEIAHELELPIRLVRDVLFDLTESGVLNEVKVNGHPDFAYQPAHSIEHLKIVDVVDALDNLGISDIPLLSSGESEKIKGALAGFHDMIQQSPDNLRLKDI